jgi:hypothetical protein
MSSVTGSTKKISLYVPKEYALPPLLQTATPEQTSTVLMLGCEMYDTLHSKALDTIRNETHSEAVKEAKEMVQAAADIQIKKLRQERTQFEEALQAAKIRLEALEQASLSVYTQSKKEAQESFQTVLNAKDQTLRDLKEEFESSVRLLGGKIESLQNSFTKNFSSSKEKGSIGEIMMEGFLKKAFDSDVHIISKDSENADIRMTRNQVSEYLWEVKNYTRPVNKHEVEKLRRDMRLHPEVRCGILVSLRTGIVEKTRGGDIDIEFLEDGRCMLFLSNFLSRDDPVFYLQTLRPYFDLLEELTKPSTENSELVRQLEAKSMLIANLLRSHAQSVSKHKNSLVGHKKRMDQMFTEFDAYLIESESQLQSLLRVAVGSQKDMDEVKADSETYLSPLVFTKERLGDLEGRTKQFVAWLLGDVEVREGTQMEIKELVDRAKEKGFGEKFVRDLRKDVFQGTAWAQGSRFILGLRWR